MFHSLTIKQIRQIVKDFKEHHNIRNYHKLKKSDLIHELEKQFEIDGGYLYLKGGTAKNAGYVRRMEAENKIMFDKIHNPSKYMIDKYGNKHAEPEYYPEPEFHHEPAPLDAHEAPLFAENEQVDFNVGKKPKKKVTKTRTPTEAEEERQEETKRKELEKKKKLLDEYELIKKQIVECKTQLQKENNTYRNVLEDIQKNKERLKKKDKEERQEQVILKHLSNIKKIKEAYPQVFEYIKSHKLNENDLNEVHKHVRMQINKM
jgi:hypothetical protein